MVIFAGVDGTGEFSNANYQDRFAHSHVNKLSRGEGLSDPQAWIFQPFYHRGPRIIGNDTFIQACKVFYPELREKPRPSGRGWIARRTEFACFSASMLWSAIAITHRRFWLFDNKRSAVAFGRRRRKT